MYAYLITYHFVDEISKVEYKRHSVQREVIFARNSSFAQLELKTKYMTNTRGVLITDIEHTLSSPESEQNYIRH